MTFAKPVRFIFAAVLIAALAVSLKVNADDDSNHSQPNIVEKIPDKRDQSTQVEAVPLKETGPHAEDQGRLDPSAASNMSVGVTIPLFSKRKKPPPEPAESDQN